MPLGTQSYRASIASWAEKLSKESLEGLARASIQDICEGVIDDTHVDTGFLVGSWQPAIGEPLVATGGLGAGVSSPKIALTLVELKIGDIFYYTNSVSYAVYQEYGTHKMAGVHMVGKNVANWQQYVVRAAVRLNLA